MPKMFVDRSTDTSNGNVLVLFAHDLSDIHDVWRQGRSLAEETMPDYAEAEQIERAIASHGLAWAFEHQLHVKGTKKSNAFWLLPGDPLPEPTAPEYW